LRLGIVKKKKFIQTHTTFPMQVDGMRLLNKLAREHGLCPKMCFLQLETVECLGIEEDFCGGICNHAEDINSYNSKVQNALADLQSSKPTVAVFGQGRNKEELTCIIINNKDELHTGFVPSYGMKMPIKKLMKLLEPAALNEFIRSTIMNHAEENPEKCVVFE
jgi:DNA polymerase-3 subunit epsilon